MNVQELIEKLQQIEDKTKEVCCISWNDCFYVYRVEEDIYDVFLKEWESERRKWNDNKRNSRRIYNCYQQITGQAGIIIRRGTKVIMTEERIKAICKKIARVHSDYDHTEETTAACVDAITWYRKAVWHDATESPQDGRMLLTDGQAGPLICGPNTHDWDETVKLFGVMCWAYVDDLRPEE